MRFSVISLLAVAAAVVAQDTVSVTAGGECEPHGDHWHCPDGVPEPTGAPTPEQLASHSAEEAAEEATSGPASTIASTTVTVVSSGSTMITASASHSHDDEDDHDHEATASTCEPHGDHWHCPAGVAEPTTAPAETVSGTATVTGDDAASAAESSALPEQTENAAVAVGAGKVAAVLGAAAFFL
ncbi:uncharacterized protein J4E87_000791 [Alternaria ethzedia]|uniref:uncharacterized protein n=1 Tax=Alternaria ethzedia TaxID=181014 RepID=UPI0020C1BB1A|nr:uncharacterized protein J4E87_000791 [Alternaria ethzedia]XP_049247020.1 uncharacterized protein J4E84_002372 [Alternaria hordeiaustralica]KAI4635834.1 hypothetical protein J4E87_000791 [Alternaria ethzedia]KAI4693796.1 hypothetical protein J4E84_002372 [Alternaria hordeiaustralica]